MSFLTLSVAMAVLTGLVGLFRGTAAFARSAPLKEVNKGIALLAIALAAGWACYTYLWLWLAIVILIFSGTILFALIEGYLMYFDIRSRERIVMLVFTGLMIVALFLSLYWDSVSAAHARKRVEAQRRAVAAVEKQRTYWRPGRDVSQAATGRILGYLAAADYVPIDWEYELELEKTQPVPRRIPIKVVLLNNSFEDVNLTAMSGWTSSLKDEYWLWRVWVTPNDSSRVIREWAKEVSGKRILLSPMQKVESVFDWDGRDHEGKLMPAGNYLLHLETATALTDDSPLEMTRAITIEDAGPEVVYQADPHMERLRQQERWNTIFRDMQQSMSQNWQSQSMFRQPR